MTIDGFVAGPNGELDWMWLPAEKDDSVFQQVIDIADSSDTILLGRKMTPGFIEHWENVTDNQLNSPEHPLATRMVNMRKIVFSRTHKEMKGRNLNVENEDLVKAVDKLKNESGKDILVYGGADFVSSLIKANLIDEYLIFRNPVAIGQGLRIFSEQKPLKLIHSKVYKSGKTLESYLPV